MTIWLLYLLLLRATLTSFTGIGALPVVRDELVVRRAVLSDVELNASLAISQASPGPLGLYVVVVGYFVAGVPGAVAGMLALATPALFAIPLLRIVQRGRSDIVRGSSDGIVLASLVLTAMTAFGLARESVSTLPLAIIAVAGFTAVATGRLPSMIAVLLAALGAVLLD
jgi:chromate transporter